MVSKGNGAPGGLVRADCAAALTTATTSTAPLVTTRILHIAYSRTERVALAKLLARHGNPSNFYAEEQGNAPDQVGIPKSNGRQQSLATFAV
jgi:hypothetical protein